MKFFILSAFALLTAGSVSAQTYQEPNRFELGIVLGKSKTSVPKESLYTGESTFWNNFAGIKALGTIREYFQVGLEISGTKWSSTDNRETLIGHQGEVLRTDTITYVFARPAISFLAIANGIIPIYKDQRYTNIANIHLGIALGPTVAINDGATGTVVYNGITYLDSYNFSPGSGFTFGFQAGYTHYIKDHVGIGVEYAPRYSTMGNMDSRMAGANNRFSLWSHAISLNVRYRW